MMAKRAGIAAPENTPAPEAARVAGRAGVASEAAGTAGQAMATPEAAVVARTADQAAAKSVAPAHPADPKIWLRQINALRAAGKAALADEEMRRFKAAFPDYAIPAAAPAGPVSPTPDLPKK